MFLHVPCRASSGLVCDEQQFRQGILSNNLTIMLNFDFVPYFYQIDHGDQEFISYLLEVSFLVTSITDMLIFSYLISYFSYLIHLRRVPLQQVDF